MKRNIILGILSTLFIGSGIAYGIYLSNVVTISNNTVTTSEASLKMCDATGINRWNTSLNPSMTLSNMVPGEERDVFAGRTLKIGNDGGALDQVSGTSQCNGYTAPLGHSAVSLRIVPTVVYTVESCQGSIANDIQLKFDIDSQTSGYKSLQSWSTNSQELSQLLTPNATGTLKAYAQLASTSTVQNGNCAFTIALTGRQSS